MFLGLATAVLGTFQTFWILKVSRDDQRWWRRAAFSAALNGVVRGADGLAGWLWRSGPTWWFSFPCTASCWYRSFWRREGIVDDGAVKARRFIMALDEDDVNGRA